MKTSVLKIFSAILLFLLLTGCVDQQSKPAKKYRRRSRADHHHIGGLCRHYDKLDVDLVAIADSQLKSPPPRYANLPTIGMAI